MKSTHLNLLLIKIVKVLHEIWKKQNKDGKKLLKIRNRKYKFLLKKKEDKVHKIL